MPASVTGRFTVFPRGDEPRAVPEHRHVLDVVPRTDVRQPRPDEVRLLRDVGQLRAAIGTPATPRPQQELVRDRARQVHQVLVPRLGARRPSRHRDGGRHEQGEDEREQDEAPRGHWPTSVPDSAPNDNPGGSLDDVGSGRRLTLLVVALALVGAPAVALTAFCVGQSCADEDQVATAVPFCALPGDLRAQIEAGFRQGHSPDVMAAASGGDITGGTAGSSNAAWPHAPLTALQNSVPIVWFGHGVNPGEIPPGTGLDSIAPTVAQPDRIRPAASGDPERGADAEPSSVRTPILRSWSRSSGRASGARRSRTASRVDGNGWRREATSRARLRGTTGSLPVEPATTLTTIGTGGLPFQHGITGTLIRDRDGDRGAGMERLRAHLHHRDAARRLGSRRRTSGLGSD